MTVVTAVPLLVFFVLVFFKISVVCCKQAVFVKDDVGALAAGGSEGVRTVSVRHGLGAEADVLQFKLCLICHDDVFGAQITLGILIEWSLCPGRLGVGDVESQDSLWHVVNEHRIGGGEGLCNGANG